jgi:hypothetical protein
VTSDLVDPRFIICRAWRLLAKRLFPVVSRNWAIDIGSLGLDNQIERRGRLALDSMLGRSEGLDAGPEGSYSVH